MHHLLRARTLIPVHLRCIPGRLGPARIYSSNLPQSPPSIPGDEGDSESSVLMQPDELYDSFHMTNEPPSPESPHRTRVTVINNPPLFGEPTEPPSKAETDGGEETRRNFQALKHLHLTPQEIQNLHRFVLIRKRVYQMTGKGKLDSMYVLIVMGNGNGLVGFGEGKDVEIADAMNKAVVEAVKNLDYVDRFEGRTLWSDLESKLGATRVLMRPRPVGFGLRCNPYLHQVLKAAGIRDVSAKVWGSRNGMNIVKASIRVLHGGNAVLGMGDGVGGPGRRLESGVGMRGRDVVERERGRKLIDARLW